MTVLRRSPLPPRAAAADAARSIAGSSTDQENTGMGEAAEHGRSENLHAVVSRGRQPQATAPAAPAPPAFTLEPRYTPPAGNREISLIGKLAEATVEMEAVPRNGYHEQGEYHYVLEGDLFTAVRHALGTRRVILTTAELARERRTAEYVKKGGEIMSTPLVDVLVRFTFLDGDSGETYAFHLTGTRPDRDGTGGIGAITNAMKTALSKTFMIPVDPGDAAEGHASGRDSAPRASSGQRRGQTTGGAQTGTQGALEDFQVRYGAHRGKRLGDMPASEITDLADEQHNGGPSYAAKAATKLLQDRGWVRGANGWQTPASPNPPADTPPPAPAAEGERGAQPS